MASIKNPNFKSRTRTTTASTKARAARQKSEAQRKSGISKAAIRRGARPGFKPTSGPGKELSKKQQKRRDRAVARTAERGKGVEKKAKAEKEKQEGKKSEETMEIDA